MYISVLYVATDPPRHVKTASIKTVLLFIKKSI